MASSGVAVEASSSRPRAFLILRQRSLTNAPTPTVPARASWRTVAPTPGSTYARTVLNTKCLSELYKPIGRDPPTLSVDRQVVRRFNRSGFLSQDNEHRRTRSTCCRHRGGSNCPTSAASARGEMLVSRGPGHGQRDPHLPPGSQPPRPRYRSNVPEINAIRSVTSTTGSPMSPTAGATKLRSGNSTRSVPNAQATARRSVFTVVRAGSGSSH